MGSWFERRIPVAGSVRIAGVLLFELKMMDEAVTDELLLVVTVTAIFFSRGALYLTFVHDELIEMAEVAQVGDCM